MRRAITLLALSVAGCAAPPPPPPPASLALTIKASGDLNPDPSGHAAPVAVRLVFLSSTAGFERADALALAEREQATLGADDLGSTEFIIHPGETRTIDTAPKPGSQALGIVVLFRDIDHARWRASTPVAASGPTRLTLQASGLVAALVSQ